jgi:hypothetical protein
MAWCLVKHKDNFTYYLSEDDWERQIGREADVAYFKALY